MPATVRARCFWMCGGARGRRRCWLSWIWHEARLPAVQASSARAGVVNSVAAAETGLAEGTLVVTGASDTACSALGAGAVESGALLLTLSSGGQLVLPIEDSMCGCAWANPHILQRVAAGRGSRVVSDGGNSFGGTGAALAARRGVWPAGQGRVRANVGVGGRIARRAPRAVLPAVSVGRTDAAYGSAARGVFLGLTAEHGRAELAAVQ